MPTGGVPRRGELRTALSRYLARHPEAADSLIGIRQWWLPEPLQEVSIEELRATLLELVDVGEVRVSTLPDGTELYARTEPDAPSGGAGSA